MKPRFFSAFAALLLVHGLAPLAAQLIANKPVAIVNLASAGCLDQRDGSPNNGATIQQWECATGNDNQLWRIVPTKDGFYRIVAPKGKDLTWNVADRGKEPGSRMQLWAYGGGDNEQFKPAFNIAAKAFEFIDRNSGLCVTIPDGSQTNGVQPILQPCQGSSDQFFTLSQP